ncbi:winged helix-turn-helix transcriptional regulator [Desulforhopalus singaporensis]|uniref:HTH domain-containing protein n=1 Tax=Desulforhopalus singaporensis TaxID=91360 RepID=A0A1H0S361_9BACT|nr:helix-turn-helix domain-containing protein [Desulforhopalus singaporensis]SDP36150.1 HTH domain-containing protein [Desulforhopalus singaporensis]
MLLNKNSLDKNIGIVSQVILDHLVTNNFQNQAALAKELGISSRTINNHITKLKELGLLTVTRRGGGKTAIYKTA